MTFLLISSKRFGSERDLSLIELGLGIISSFQTFELKYDLAWLKFENIWEVSLDQIFRPEVGPLNFKIKIKNFQKFWKFRNFFYQNFNLPKSFLLFEAISTSGRQLLSRDNLEKKNNILLMWLGVACKSFLSASNDVIEGSLVVIFHNRGRGSFFSSPKPSF